jgi:hypothetical protein
MTSKDLDECNQTFLQKKLSPIFILKFHFRNRLKLNLAD